MKLLNLPNLLNLPSRLPGGSLRSIRGGRRVALLTGNLWGKSYLSQGSNLYWGGAAEVGLGAVTAAGRFASQRSDRTTEQHCAANGDGENDGQQLKIPSAIHVVVPPHVLRLIISDLTTQARQPATGWPQVAQLQMATA
jgi:hypothetical protein